uniref:Uncharacterized protein n=1 Tax=Anguilla anguilla TaxID=7936 RepID=A0A0E9VJU2_ANGAN
MKLHRINIQDPFPQISNNFSISFIHFSS